MGLARLHPRAFFLRSQCDPWGDDLDATLWIRDFPRCARLSSRRSEFCSIRSGSKTFANKWRPLGSCLVCN